MGDVRIERLLLSVKAYDVLKDNNIDFLSQILKLRLSEISAFNKIERETIKEIHKLQLDFSKNKGKNYFANAENCNLEIDLNEKVIFLVFPELKKINSYELFYVDESEAEINNYFFRKSDFSVRTFNALTNANLLDIMTICNLNSEDLKSVKNFGTKSYEEVLSFLKAHIKYTDMDSANYIDFNSLLSKFPIQYKENIKTINNANLNKIIKESLLKTWQEEKEPSVNELKEILFNSDFEKWMSDFLLKTVYNAKNISLKELSNLSPKIFVDNGIFKVSLDSLLINGKIEKTNNGEYRIKLPTLGEWLSTLSEKERTLINMRLNGATLQECGEYSGLTRERVRQIISKVFSKKPQLREDVYIYWYTKYNLAKDIFVNIFEEKERTYEYLKINYSRGELDWISILDDDCVTESIYKRTNAQKFKECIIIGNKTIPIRRLLIIKELAKLNYRDNDVCLNDFYTLYSNFLIDNNLSNVDSLTFPNERSFEARVCCQNFILSKQWRRIRYYEINEIDIVAVVNQLNLNQYINVEISTKKILKDNKDLFEEIDIRDEYELHNLLKKTLNIWNPNNKFDLSIDRMPTISFGNANVENQVLELLKASAPISTKDFWKLYEEEYGNNHASAMANYGKYIDKYLTDGEYKIDMLPFDEDELHFMLSKITDDFYTIEEVKKIYLSKFKNSLNKINSMNLKMLGYKVYSGYVLKSCFTGTDSFFKEIILKNNTFNINGGWKQSKISNMLTTSAYNSLHSVLDDLKFNKIIFEYSDGMFIKADYFFSVERGLSNKIMDDFVDQAIKFASDESFFTIESIIKDGFYDRFESLGFGNYFSSALIKNSKKVKYMRFGGNFIFYFSNEVKFSTDFISFVLNDYKSIDIYKFIDLLKNSYSVNVPKDKIVTILKDTDFYYSSTMNKIYSSKEDYYCDLNV